VGKRTTLEIDVAGDHLVVARTAHMDTELSSDRWLVMLALCSLLSIALFCTAWLLLSELPALPDLGVAEAVVATVLAYLGYTKGIWSRWSVAAIEQLVANGWPRAIVIMGGAVTTLFLIVLAIRLIENRQLAREIDRFYDFAMTRDIAPETTSAFSVFLQRWIERPEAWSILATRHGIELQGSPDKSGLTVATALGIQVPEPTKGGLDDEMLRDSFSHILEVCQSTRLTLDLPTFPSLGGSPVPDRDHGCRFAIEAFGNIADGLDARSKGDFYRLYDELLLREYEDQRMIMEQIDVLESLVKESLDAPDSPRRILNSAVSISRLRGDEMSYSERRTFLTVAANAAICGCVDAGEALRREDREALRQEYEVTAYQIVGLMLAGLDDEADADSMTTYAGPRRLLPLAWFFGESLRADWLERYDGCFANKKNFKEQLSTLPELRTLRADELDILSNQSRVYGRVTLQLPKSERPTWNRRTLEFGDEWRGY